MFEQVRYPVLIGLFVAAADARPNPECGGLQMRHGIGDDGEARRQLGDFNAHPVVPSLAARLTERTNRAISTLSFFITWTRSDLVIKPSSHGGSSGRTPQAASTASGNLAACAVDSTMRSEEHTSELQSHVNLVCR